jgi:beta-glucanase (GH16 family)
MVNYQALLSILAVAKSVHAWGAPGYSGYSLVWQDAFAGSGGTSPNTGNWNLINGYLNVNNEYETYTSSTRNIQLSGGNTVQLVPWRDSSTIYGWTSGRMESTYVFTPATGKITRVEAEIRFGGNAQSAKQGMWPAFWLLGDAIRHGVAWPKGGELDIMERVNGVFTGYGTVHCQQASGGICNEPNGIGAAVGIPDDGWHTWRLEFDRTNGDWTQQKITWYFDGGQFHQITGSRIGDYNTWVALCQTPQYFLLNLAVGGSWVRVYLSCLIGLCAYTVS